MELVEGFYLQEVPSIIRPTLFDLVKKFSTKFLYPLPCTTQSPRKVHHHSLFTLLPLIDLLWQGVDVTPRRDSVVTRAAENDLTAMLSPEILLLVFGFLSPRQLGVIALVEYPSFSILRIHALTK